MDNGVNSKLSGILSGLSGDKASELMRLVSSKEGQELVGKLSDEEKKAIIDRFMSLDKTEAQNSLKRFKSSGLSGLSAQDILNKLR